MKYKQSQLLILASTLTFLGVPGISSNETILNFVATPSAQAGHGDKDETPKKTKAAKPSFFKRLMNRANVPTTSRQHFPSDIDVSGFDTSDDFIAPVQAKTPEKKTPPTAAIRTQENSKAVTPTLPTPSVQAPAPQDAVEEIGAVQAQIETTQEPSAVERRSHRKKATRHYHQAAVSQVVAAAPLTQEMSALRSRLNMELQRNNQEIQGLTQQLNALHQETCEAESKLSHCRRIENTQRERVEKVRSEAQRSAVKMNLIENRDSSVGYLQDQLSAHLIQSWTHTGKWAFLAIGNSKTVQDQMNHKEIRRLVQGLNQAGYEILYDADSNEAEIIANAASGNALGVSGRAALRNLGNTSTLVIENPFLRMQTIASVSKIIMTPDSVLGLGLLLEEFTTSSKEFLVYDSENVWKKGLSTWQSSLSEGYEHSSGFGAGYGAYTPSGSYDAQGNYYGHVGKNDKSDWARAKERAAAVEREREREREREKKPRNLGIRFPFGREPKAYARMTELLNQLTGTYWESRKQPTEPAEFLKSHLPVSLLTVVDQIDASVLQNQLSFATTYHESAARIRAHGQENNFHNAGAAFFGSKEAPAEFEKTVKQVVEAATKRGFPITTGGSGGLMDTANRVAKETQGFSIGIPCGGVVNEVSANHLHDLNISTKGYEQRIPLILLDKKLVMIAPGGSGTMKEVATTLVQIAAGDLASQTHLMFIGRKYYQGLGVFFNQVLPPIVVENMSILDSAQEFETIYQDFFEPRMNL